MDQDPRRRRERTSRRGNGHNGGRRKPSPSPTRCPGTELKKPSASPPPPPPRTPGWMEPPLPAPAGDGSWLILDRFVHYSRRHRGVIEGDATNSSLAEDCAGRQVRVSLRIADPPAVSRLYLHWTDRPHTDLPFSMPIAIAAHRNSILFRMTVPFDDPMWWHDTPSFPIEHFVYSCCSSSPPSLTPLPPCFEGGDEDPDLDKLVRPHRRQRQRTMFNAEMGILCHDDNGYFTVAHLAYRSQKLELCLVHHQPSAGVPMDWSLKQLDIPLEMKIDLDSWRTDVVVPIGRSLCWVDYYQGMLLVDVLTTNSQSSPKQQQLHSIRLPSQLLKYRRLYNDAGDPDPFRHVCVTDSGIIKLVCVFVNRSPSDDGFKIITWTLVDIDKGSWIKDVDTTMGADEFFDLFDAAESCLPRVKPTFPVMSLVDPDVICFLLKEKDCNLTWMVEVNMRKKILLSSALYIAKKEEEAHPSQKDCKNGFYGHYFIPTKFSSYLSKDAITSRKLSEAMQKAKEERAMQKAKEERAMQKAKEGRATHKPKERGMK